LLGYEDSRLKLELACAEFEFLAWPKKTTLSLRLAPALCAQTLRT